MLRTPYIDKMNADMPHDYHPTPQFKRDSFICLNGKWDFSLNESADSCEYDSEILVPFCPESDLSGIGKSVLPHHYMHYRRRFNLDEKPVGCALLHFGAVDTECEVKVNGTVVDYNVGGYIPFTIDVTDALTIGENTIELTVKDTLDPKYPYGKQKYKRGGIWYTPVSGIWQTVWLELVPKNYIRDIKITPYEKGVKIAVAGCDGNKKITLKQSGEIFESEDNIITVEPSDVKLWTPETPHIYEFSIECGEDKVDSYFAIRWVDVRNVDGVNRICLNGKPYLFNGMLDQGYYSDGIYMPATVDGYIDDIKLTKALGFNMLRKHIKIEPMIFYYLCDTMGIAVFQDMINNGVWHPFRDALVPTAIPTLLQKFDDRGFSRDPDARRIWEETMYKTADHLYNVPSVVYYTIFNEGWGQFCADEMYAKLKAFDKTRILDATSGWFRRKDSDVDSRHIYFRKLNPKKQDGRPLIISEFGGYAHAIKGHTFSPKEFGYKVFSSREDFEDKVVSVYENEVKPLVEAGASAFVYTQVSDVEDEINGFVTYDRQVVKINTERLKKINNELAKIGSL